MKLRNAVIAATLFAIIGPVAANAAVPAGAIKASFDCAKAGTRIEHLICSDPVLAELDVAMGMQYKSIMEVANDKKHHREQQREWIKERNRCQDAQCVADSYTEHLEQLDMMTRYMSNSVHNR